MSQRLFLTSYLAAFLPLSPCHAPCAAADLTQTPSELVVQDACQLQKISGERRSCRSGTVGSPGGWFGHSATVPKHGWDGSEERSEAMKTTCLPWHPRAAFACSPWGMQSSASHSSFVPRSLQVCVHQNSWSHTIFKTTLYNSNQLPAL